VLNFIKKELEPVFCPGTPEETSHDTESSGRKSGIFTSLFSNLASNIYVDKSYQQIENNKNRLMRD